VADAAVSPRRRILAFGSAAALVVAGAICALFVAGATGTVLASALVTLGLGAVVLLVFLEVGLSEDRDRAQEEERRRKQAAKRAPTEPRRPRARLPRRRG
jgi:hypothetical protein